MTRPKVRIGTLVLLVVIAALAVALVVEKRRPARRPMGDDTPPTVQMLREQATRERAGQLGTAAEAYGLEPAVFSAHVEAIADDDLDVDSGQVLEDLLAITEGLPRPVDLSDASAAYVVYRRDRKQGRAEAVRSTRDKLGLDAALAKAVAK